MTTATAEKTGTAEAPQETKSQGAVAKFQPPRLPYHPAIEERFGVKAAEWKALVEAVFPLAQSVDSVILALSYCKARKLDPFKRVVHIVPIWDKNYVAPGGKKGRYVDTIWPGIGELRTTAFRTKQYAGADACQFGPMTDRTFSSESDNGERRNITVKFPEWAQLTVYRMIDGQRVPIPGPRVYWAETYSRMGRTELPNDMWQRRPVGQLEKCFDSATEILTDRGFQRFAEVDGRVMQVMPDGSLTTTDAKPFARAYGGDMIALHSRDLDFAVTPNHDMITTVGKIEAGALYNLAQTKARFWIPRCIGGSSIDFAIPDKDIRLAAAFLADGFDGHGGKLTIKVSKPAKRHLLMALSPIEVIELENAGSVAIAANGRAITTRQSQTAYIFEANRVIAICDPKKTINFETIMRLSRRQARLFVDTWLECDGNRNRKTGVRRLYTSRPHHAAAFELAAILAGLSVSDWKSRISDIGTKPNFVLTVSERSEIGVIRWGAPHSRSKDNIAGRTGLEIEPNADGQVWCVTVPSGAIVVRRHGFSMVCGNCAEAAALRRAFPEELGDEHIDDEVGVHIGPDNAKDVNPRPTREKTAAAAQYAEEAPEPFAIVTGDGEERTFDSADDAAAAFAAMLQKATTLDVLNGLWESNNLLAQLVERGHADQAGALSALYTEMVERLRKPPAQQQEQHPEPPPSPMKLKGKAREDAWPAWEAWALAELARMPRADVAGFMERHKAELDFVAENRAASWQKFEEVIDAKRDQSKEAQ